MNVTDIWNRIRRTADSGERVGACFLSQSDCRLLLASTRPQDEPFYGPGLNAPALALTKFNDFWNSLTYPEKMDVAATVADRMLEAPPAPAKLPAKLLAGKGGVCRDCGGPTTYTRQNSETGQCMKCELKPTARPLKLHHHSPITKEMATRWVDEQCAILKAMPDSAIDTSDIPEVKDWSKAEVGKFYRSCNVLNAAIGPDTYDLVDILKVAHRLRAIFGPHYLKPAVRRYRPAKARKSWGLCYAASEALYHLGAKELGFQPAYIANPEGGQRTPAVSHWFLVRKNKSGHMQVLDITADQFSMRGRLNLHKSYAKAKCSGFLTKKPSARAYLLMQDMEHCHFRRIVEGRIPLEEMDETQ